MFCNRDLKKRVEKIEADKRCQAGNHDFKMVDTYDFDASSNHRYSSIYYAAPICQNCKTISSKFYGSATIEKLKEKVTELQNRIDHFEGVEPIVKGDNDANTTSSTT